MRKTILLLILITNLLSAKNGISLNLGTDFSLVTLKISYFHDIKLDMLDRNLQIKTEFATPLLRPDLNDFKFLAGASIDTVKSEKLKLPVEFNLVIRGTSNDICNIIGFGTAITIAPGYYEDKFHIAPEFTLDNQWFSNITYTDLYKKLVYKNSKEGMMGPSSTTIRVGLNTGVKLNNTVQLNLKGGWEYHGSYNFKSPPFYIILGSKIGF